VWKLKGRTAESIKTADPDTDVLAHFVHGYLVGDRIVPDDVRVDPDPMQITKYSEQVYLLEPGLDRFVRVAAGRVYPEGPLIYTAQEFPMGPEDAVLNAFLNKEPFITMLAEVTPALDAAFRMEWHQREQAELRRLELEQQRQEEEAQRRQEERRERLREQLGDGAARRELALTDFETAARAALAIGGAELLDIRKGHHKTERVVKFRFTGRRFECVCDTRLQIVDAGICLADHRTDEKGDTYFTLESLPGVIAQAMREEKLVVFRHV
jgi:hypothetical protein